MANAADRVKVSKLREQLPAVHTTGYFNTGTNGPMAKSTIEAMIAVLNDELTRGRIYPAKFEDLGNTADALRRKLAQLLGGSANEYALCQSTNDGLNIALNGISWNPCDEVVTTSLEHPGLFVPLSLLGHRFGIRTRVAEIGDGGGDVLGAIAKLVKPRTRAIALSHVMWSSGAIVDLKPIADLAHEHGALLIVDGAQSIGQVPVDMPSTGADAYTVSGQKWLAGPEGSGAVWISSRAWSDIAPSSVRYGQCDPTGYYLPAAGARRYEMGENNPAVVRGLGTAIDFMLDEVDQDWAHARIVKLGKRLHGALSKVSGVTMHTPINRSAGLICFNVAGIEPPAVSKELFERGFTIRYVVFPPGPSIARIAVGWWNTEDEIDALVLEIGKIAANGSTN